MLPTWLGVAAASTAAAAAAAPGVQVKVDEAAVERARGVAILADEHVVRAQRRRVQQRVYVAEEGGVCVEGEHTHPLPQQLVRDPPAARPHPLARLQLIHCPAR